MKSSTYRLLACVFFIVLFVCVRSFRQKKLIEANSFLQISWGVGGVVLITSVFVKALTNQDLLNLIGEDGALALLIGVGTQIVVSLDNELQQDFGFVYSGLSFINRNKSSQESSISPSQESSISTSQESSKSSPSNKS